MKPFLTLRICFIALLILTLLCQAEISKAVTRNVPFQYSNIQAAVNAAVNGDTVLVGTGTYIGSGNVNVDTLGKAITIKSYGGAGSCVIDGSGTDRFFYIHNGETTKTVINGFTFQNGYAGVGSAIYINNSMPTISGCVFTNNNSYSYGAVGIYEDTINFTPGISNCFFYNNYAGNYGGAIWIYRGSTKVTNCTFQGNTGEISAGAVYINATGGGYSEKSKFTNCTFIGNSVVNTGGYGGGLFIDEFSQAAFVNCLFDSNNSEAGGAAFVFGENSAPTFTNSTFSNNNVTYNGGAIFFNGTLGKLTGCVFNNNHASNYGGGINSRTGKQTISNCTFSNNTSAQGAGMSIDGTNTVVTNCSFKSNSAANGPGGGIFIGNLSSSGPSITGCLFYNNSATTYGGGIMTTENTVVKNCIFEANLAFLGGAFSAFSGSSKLVNSVFKFNSSASIGASVWMDKYSDGVYPTLQMTNCSSYGNYNTNNSALYPGIYTAADGATLNINNCILYDNNQDYAELYNAGGAVINVNYSNILGGWGGAESHNISANPLYTNPGIGDLTLQMGSPCINAASKTAPSYQTKDIVNSPRVGLPDMGAYEHM